MSELQVFTYLPQRPARPKAARLAPVGLTSLFLPVGKTGCRLHPSQPGQEGRSGTAENLPAALGQGDGSGTDVKGKDVPARSGIPGKMGLKQSLSCSMGHLRRRHGMRCEF